jgi:aminopeptidase
MPDVTADTILRMFPADYSQVVEKTEKLKELMAASEEIKVTSELGTNLILPVKNRRVIASTGVLHNIGASGNIPSGEASITPWEDKAYGTIVIDGTIGGLGKVINPITIEVVDGSAVSFTGKGGEAKVLSRLLNKYGEEGKVISAFGMGTNHNAIEIGMILEDEKVEGMVHVSFGNNMNLGGRIKIPMHIDATMTNSDVYFDNEQVVAKGKLLI